MTDTSKTNKHPDNQSTQDDGALDKILELEKAYRQYFSAPSNTQPFDIATGFDHSIPYFRTTSSTQ